MWRRTHSTVLDGTPLRGALTGAQRTAHVQKYRIPEYAVEHTVVLDGTTRTTALVIGGLVAGLSGGFTHMFSPPTALRECAASTRVLDARMIECSTQPRAHVHLCALHYT